MPSEKSKNTGNIGWMGLRKGQHSRTSEVVAEVFIKMVSMTAILMILLIFIFIGREALPIVFGQMNSSLVQKALTESEMQKLPKEELREYLGLSKKEFTAADEETIKLLIEVKLETLKEIPNDKDAGMNTTSWHSMTMPHQWTGYDKPEYIWQPISAIHKYNIIPLVIGSLKATFVALLFSVPLSLGAAIYVSQMASPKIREIVKPCIELLAGIPSVVLGVFAALVLASVLQNVFGYQSRLNAFVAGISLGLAVIPVVFTISEDALTSVPGSYTQAALALGASRWQAAWQVVLPAALPGVFAATILGFGRAIGETMIVLMASGNASLVSANIFESVRTITATIAAELAETVFGGHHYRILFTIGLLLFTITFIANLLGEVVVQRLKRKLEGRA